MSILDSVYKTFSNLDRDYSRSKKTRTEFITDKFGGDIDTGSIIILDAIREEGVSDSPEDIEKLSFIKDSFAFFQENAKRLDKLENFSHSNADVFFELMGILSDGDAAISGQYIVPQDELWDCSYKALHFITTYEGTTYVPLSACKVFSMYNENMLGVAASVTGDTGVALKMGDKFRIGAGGRIRLLADAAIGRHVR